jgi:hypothetical protein
MRLGFIHLLNDETHSKNLSPPPVIHHVQASPSYASTLHFSLDLNLAETLLASATYLLK